jgi:nucleotide-binding universal stress UspA family protein
MATEEHGMKTVLVPVEDHEGAESVLESALLFARRFGSYVEAVSTLPVIDNYIVGEMVPLWPPNQRTAGDTSREALARFEAFMARHGVARLPAGTAEAVGAEPCWGAREQALLGDSAVASHARVFDVTVVGRPSGSAAGPRLSLLEAVVFESGRPILIAPPASPAIMGENVMIAWNYSTETARATALAIPVLRRASRVRVLTVEGVSTTGPSGEELARTLNLNGIPADASTVAARGRSVGEGMLDEAMNWGADLLIKGAYTQSRLRQMIFGGATSHILANATIPVFMAH